MADRLNTRPQWDKLKEHANRMQSFNMSESFQSCDQRAQHMSMEHCGIFFDYSKNLMDEETMSLLMDLVKSSNFEERRQAMFQGQRINHTENRGVLHTALRADGKPGDLMVEGQDVYGDIQRVLEQMRQFTAKVHSGQWKGHSGRKIRYIVNIGIGGSDLGPKMVVESLRDFVQSDYPEVHFVSNVDANHLMDVLNRIHIDETLFIVASKTFTTQETMTNAVSAKNAVIDYYGEESAVARHFIAISTNEEKVTAFGIDPINIFEFWDWVGGRFSLWSAIGLPIALGLGWDNYLELLRGARDMDDHFYNAPIEDNMPVVLAVIGVWYANFLGWETRAILPYSEHLVEFPSFLQQLEMESNGKSTTLTGEKVEWATGNIIWGKAGTNGQHAFFQLIHQGTKKIPCDFISFVHPKHRYLDHHQKLLANCLAQTEALMNGKTYEVALEENLASGMTQAEAESLAPHRVFDGNHPTNTLLLEELNPHVMGGLIALYEHKVFVQGAIWQINSFDQYGVELGKQLAGPVLEDLQSTARVNDHDPSTNQLIDFIHRHLGGVQKQP